MAQNKNMPEDSTHDSVFSVEIAYAANPGQQCILKVLAAKNQTLQEIIIQSGILEIFPDINLATQSIGIFGKKCQLANQVSPGDRIEIYRPLLIDPKEARRKAAAKIKNERSCSRDRGK